MGQALYRKYRSKNLSEIVGQEHITDTLKQALKSGHISHAYLFTGPHGVGKTSVARILAHEINGLPYTDDTSYMDIIEIDAASNRRIDEIRELREKVYVAPTSAKYKVYIIDEVHMLTREAFNALLKTLEEPPAHVVFILATTDAHKLPETIISRTQRYTFRPADKAKVVSLLRTISKKEKIIVSDEALELIAEHGSGSFRDSVGLLDQARNHDQKIEAANVLSLLGIPPEQSIHELISALVLPNAINQLIQKLSALNEQGYQASMIAAQLGNIMRDQLVNNSLSMSFDDTLSLLGSLIEVPAAHEPERLLEIILLKAAQSSEAVRPKTKDGISLPIKPEPSKSNEQTKPSVPVKEIEKDNTPPALQKETSEAKHAVSKKITESSPKIVLDDAVWQKVLIALKQKHNTLYGVVRMAQPEFTPDGVVQLTFSFAFHQKRIQEAKNQQLLAAIIEQVSGHKVIIECKLDKNSVPIISVQDVPAVPPITESPDLLAISNIFGGGELLES